jgi:hypothetical protein
MVRKAAFAQVKGFDIGYWRGGEAFGLCRALQRAGWSTHPVDAARAKLDMRLDELDPWWRGGSSDLFAAEGAAQNQQLFLLGELAPDRCRRLSP